MGKPRFSTITKFFAIALLAAATSIAAIAVMSTPAAAHSHNDGGGNRDGLKSWDTDNLSRFVSSSFGRAGARNYRIPYHNYRASGYEESVQAKACVAYNIYDSDGNWQAVHLRIQNTTTGQCPTGYSPVTQVCGYASYRYGGYNQASGTYQPLVNVPASYRVPNTSGTCDPISYRPAVNCHLSSNGRYFCGRGATRHLRGSLTSVPSASLCSDNGRLSLRRSSQTCSAALTVDQAKHFGCQSAVADAFFQTGGDTGAVNDFPVADYGSESEAGSVAATGRRDRGCVEFAEQQDRLPASVTATGHYLALEGNELVLKANSGTDILDTRITSVRSAGVYGRWDQKGTGYAFAQVKLTGHTSSSWKLGTNISAVSSSGDYQRRVDTRSVLRMGTGLSSALVHPWNEATGLGAGQGNFACTGTGWIGCVERSTQSSQSGVVYFSATLGDLGTSPQFKIATSSHTSGSGAQHSGRPVHLSHAQDAGGGWCPAEWHPRGQDASYAIGNSTGRTLSSLNSEALLKAADAHWCRSDVRYTLEFTVQQHNTCGSNGRSPCAAPPGVVLPAVGSEFESYGRKNCYKTMTGYDETNAECEYVFPVVDVAVSDNVAVFDLDVSAGTQRNKLCV